MKNLFGKTLPALVAGLLLTGSFASFLPGEVIKIMAANTTSGTDQAYEEPGVRIFQALRPDIVLIQEFNYESGTLRQLVDRAFGPEYYYSVEGGSSIPNGIVSRWPILASGEWYDSVASNRDFAWAVIDIPGEKNLQVVSVHLLTSSSGDRNAEATALKGYIQANFDDNHFIVVGGDLNTGSRGEAAITTFETFLDADDHTPVDRLGNDNTNEGRTKPYDWVMPNAELDQHHTTLYVGSNSRAYPQGIVFDSHIYPDLDEVYPVQYPDSHVSGMQHMAVMKAYDIPVASPTPTITPVPSPTPHYMIDEGFDNFHLGTRPAGWTFVNCDQNEDTYTTPGYFGDALPSLKLDATGDAVATRSFQLEDTEFLRFWVKGAAVDVTSGSLLVEEFYGSAWNEITTVGLHFTERTLGPFAVNPSTSMIQFSYTRQDNACALDDVRITGPLTPTPTSTPPGFKSPTPAKTPSPTPVGYRTPVPTSTPAPTLTPPAASPVPPHPWNGDYSGDGTSDLAIFRETTGLWAVRGVTRAYFGSSGDWPVFGDYSGDGPARPAVFRESSGLWAVRGLTRTYFGGNGDIPVRGDYDGSGSCRPAIFRPSSGLWAVKGVTRLYFGGSEDLPVPGYYNPENQAQVAVFRPSTGLWAVRGVTRVYFGSGTDTPVPGDYDWSGRWSAAVFRPSSGLWALKGTSRLYFGGTADIPVPGGYAGDGRDWVGIFRENTGLWAVREWTRAYFGGLGDLPVTR